MLAKSLRASCILCCLERTKILAGSGKSFLHLTCCSLASHILWLSGSEPDIFQCLEYYCDGTLGLMQELPDRYIIRIQQYLIRRFHTYQTLVRVRAAYNTVEVHDCDEVDEPKVVLIEADWQSNQKDGDISLKLGPLKSMACATIAATWPSQETLRKQTGMYSQVAHNVRHG